MTDVLWLAAGWATAFAISVVPAFMPPMWLVLSLFHVGAGVALLPLTLGAAVAGALGRSVLALGVRRLERHLPAPARREATALGEWFERRGWKKWLAVAAYCLGPFPSNALFIAAGAGDVRIRWIAVTYAATRAVSDTVWVWMAASVVADVRTALQGSMTDWVWIAGQVIGLLLIIAVLRLPWTRWLTPHG